MKRRFLAVLLVMLLISGHAWAEKRVALVIGNGAYPNVGVLANPPNDAKLMANTLRQLDFDVIESINVDQKAMKRAISTFGQKLTDAGRDAVGLFYYAGHGVQVDGINYLIPVNVNITTEADVDIETVSANGVQRQMAYAGNRLNIIIMDACRNNPFKRGFRSAARGLAKMEATMGTLIAYATAPGDVAADGTGTNSPYTEALSKAMLTPGIAVERVFKQVRNTVVAATNKKQVPWESSSLTGGDFYFRGVAGTAAKTQTPSQPQPTMTPEMMAWQLIQNSTDPAMFEAYLEQYPRGAFTAFAKAKIKSLSQTKTAAVLPPKAKPPQTVLSPAKPAVVLPKMPKRQPGDTFKDCDACPQMVVVPPGTFLMGDPGKGGRKEEKPVHEVRIDYPFAIGKYEITIGEWLACVEAAACKGHNDKYFLTLNRNEPMNFITWSGAKAFASWLSLKTGHPYRLLSEAEWEYAARGGATTAFPWGDSFSADKAAMGERPEPVGSYPPNGFGIHDVIGNVTEWVEDCWSESHAGAPINGTPRKTGIECNKRVLRGTSYITAESYNRISLRLESCPGQNCYYDGNGIRVAMTISADDPQVPKAAPARVLPVAAISDGGHQPGQAFKDCKKCPEMVVIPAGSFIMGNPYTFGMYGGSPHKVRIKRPFAVGRYEVTFAEWDACVADGGCSHKPDDMGWGRQRLPVINVAWIDLQQYLDWLADKTGAEYRLLSEAEWEYVARAGTQKPFQTGWTITPELANYGFGENSEDPTQGGKFKNRTTVVGEFEPNGFGLYDIHGNVYEWLEDCWHDSYKRAPTDGRAWIRGGDCNKRVIRGGDWSIGRRFLAAGSRMHYYVHGTHTDVPPRASSYGFRVARDIP